MSGRRLRREGFPIADFRLPIERKQVNKYDLQARTKQFGLRVLKLIDTLPRSTSGRIVANQLGRSGTSVASNYRAACRGRSKAEFIAKLGTVEEEADESAFWID